MMSKQFTVDFNEHKVVQGGKVFFPDANVSTLKGEVDAFVIVLPKDLMLDLEGKPQPDGTFSEDTQWIGISKNKKGILIGDYVVHVSVTKVNRDNSPQKEDIFSSEEA